MAPDGFLTIVDRAKEIIITGGFNPYPSEVEAVIRTHAGVLEVAVVGLPHEDSGEEVVSAIALVEGVPLHPEELRAHLTPYQVLRRVSFVRRTPDQPHGQGAA